MDILPSEEEQMLKNVAREFLEAEVSTALVREMELDGLGYPPALWKQMADLGWDVYSRTVRWSRIAHHLPGSNT
ncbi:MAG: hypothetical protein EGP13_07720 [SAR202 cluster bacterium]|nr:MAG: hypothetical protein EGP13_07720 [SAR202 cluster bacterium]